MRALFLTLFLNLQLPVTGFPQPTGITLTLENAPLSEVFSAIRRQSNYTFVYHTDGVRSLRIASIDMSDATVREVLDTCLKGTEYTYSIEDDVVILLPRERAVQQTGNHRVAGVVRGVDGSALAGVTVLLRNTQTATSTGTDGTFTLNVPVASGELVFSFIGMKTKNVPFTAGIRLAVVLEDAEIEVGEVVVTGIYQRNKESFTGSAAHYSAQELKIVGNQNVLQSLKTLDPSFVIIENNDYGSDPNRLPDIEIRGKSSVIGLREQYDTDPNQPLFILDGFETTLKTIVELNMDRVESVTILKDAASTALYGSKAANGVVVIETKRPEPGKFRINYYGNFSLSMPDLTDYNLMNAAEKLEFERLSGFYTDDRSASDAREQLFLDQLYNQHKAAIARGVDTYWLSEPLRTALVHKHHLYAEGGDDAVRYGLGVTYNSTDGVMKQSGNNLFGANFDLQYRKGEWQFFNKMSFDYTTEKNPTVPFSSYSRANPYFEKYNENGGIDRYLEDYYTLNHTRYTIGNPLYNARLNSFDKNNKFSFVNNLNVEWRPMSALVVRGRLGIGKSVSKADNFMSPRHTMFDNYASDRKGRYTSRRGDDWYYDGDFTVTYGQLFGDAHQLNVVAGSRFRSSEATSEAYMAVGFPMGNFDTPSFATAFPDGSKPTYSRTVTRSASFYLNAGYAYDNRYLLDANIRLDGTSVFGTNKRFTETWAVGLAWNIHREAFMEYAEWLDILKIRASVGNPGNQNFSSFQAYTTYGFNNWLQNALGTSMLIDGIGNPDLKWQKTIDWNVGADVTMMHNRLHLTLDFFRKNTDPLLATITVPSSVGVTTVITNMGAQMHKGVSGTLKYSPIYRPQERINWTLSLNFRRQQAEYRDIGNSLDQYNEQNRNTSLVRYYDGGSPTALWAVRSLGINPANGREVFLKKNGMYTYSHDVADEVKVGDSEPDLQGVFGNTLYYKGFSFSFYLRYSFGGDVFNRALWSKVENITTSNVRNNQDKRALHDRWTTPGQHAQFKGITLTDEPTTQISSRFVKTENYLKGESFSVGYDFPKEWIAKAGFSSMRVQTNMNDVFRFSSVKEERGIEYPFARMVSASLSFTF